MTTSTRSRKMLTFTVSFTLGGLLMLFFLFLLILNGAIWGT